MPPKYQRPLDRLADEAAALAGLADEIHAAATDLRSSRYYDGTDDGPLRPEQRIALTILLITVRRATAALTGRRGNPPDRCQTTGRQAPHPTPDCRCPRCSYKRSQRAEVNLLSRHPQIRDNLLACLTGQAR